MLVHIDYSTDGLQSRSILHTVLSRKANWIGHTLSRKYLLKHVTEGKTEETGRRGRRSKQLLVDLKQMRGRWKLKDAALDRTLWSSHFGRRYGPVVKTDCRVNERVNRSFDQSTTLTYKFTYSRHKCILVKEFSRFSGR